MLHCYGENSFTFLLFQELNKSPELVEKFLSNLKNFHKGQKFNLKNIDTTQDSEPQIWLFPNFGKRHGFGEPDALILYGGHTFWFEVETNFDLIKRKSSARSALIQLLRFYYLNRVFTTGIQIRETGGNHRAWMGTSISGEGKLKPAVLRVAKHGVLKKVSSQIEKAAQNDQDHYIILSERKMVGLGEQSTQNRNKTLRDFYNTTTTELHRLFEERQDEANEDQEQDIYDIPLKPKISRFWYQYYEKDLKNKVITLPEDNINYIRIKSG